MTPDLVIEKKKTAVKKVQKPKEPTKYNVIVLNDDSTAVDFVIAMLVTIFNHPEQHAVQLTSLVHTAGSAVVGTYSYEVAEQRSFDATDMARSNGFPLVIKFAPV